MECNEALEVISAALDREITDAQRLADAKQHCRECRDCARFVRTMLLVKNAPLPEPSADLPDRVMRAVRVEAQRAAAAAAQAQRALERSEQAESTAETIGAPAGELPAELPSDLPADLLELAPVPRARSRGNRWAWIAAAAVFLAAAGVATVIGVRFVTGPSSADRNVAITSESASAPSATGGTATSAQPDQRFLGSAQPGSGSTSQTAGGPSYIVVGGAVYRLTGSASSVDLSLRREIGSTESNLGAGGRVATLSVYALPGTARVFVQGPDGQTRGFEPVTREYQSVTYQLTSAPILGFGVWPSLPAGIEKPAAIDGSPTFAAAGTDSGGTMIYRKAGSTTAEGIAVAPGTPPSDPAAGNTNWTWWVPKR